MLNARAAISTIKVTMTQLTGFRMSSKLSMAGTLLSVRFRLTNPRRDSAQDNEAGSYHQHDGNPIRWRPRDNVVVHKVKPLGDRIAVSKGVVKIPYRQRGDLFLGVSWDARQFSVDGRKDRFTVRNRVEDNELFFSNVVVKRLIAFQRVEI